MKTAGIYARSVAPGTSHSSFRLILVVLVSVGRNDRTVAVSYSHHSSIPTTQCAVLRSSPEVSYHSGFVRNRG